MARAYSNTWNACLWAIALSARHFVFRCSEWFDQIRSFAVTPAPPCRAVLAWEIALPCCLRAAPQPFRASLPSMAAGGTRTQANLSLTLADELDIVRGDVIAPSDHLPQVSNSFEATLVWL